jgi:hypothetical protein
MELFAAARSDYDLDGWLDLPHAKVAEMKRNLHSPSQWREAYLDLYATSHPCPSWTQVAGVLQYVGLHIQADTVESTYIRGRLLTFGACVT